ncbi:MAG: YebC/PmpR family DNA-binding transcriptional regulator [Deltaproteobacteria bacterium]|nr:YebC/PmpR family DNA-binding transcriptional regulator [Deltaproteobacteria bacterium]
MSGHSKWATIKYKKSATDAKRGKVFTKLIKEITVAARIGGGDLSANPRLRTVVMKAKDVNMPADNIKRAIQKGTGELPGISYEEFTYEGYGPGGVAVLVETLTDNKNRTVAEVRHIFSKHNGNLGENGCVAWMFQTRGLIAVEKTKVDEDRLMELALEAGAEDVQAGGDTFEITMEPGDFEAVKKSLEEAGLELSLTEITKIPSTTVRLEGKEAEQMLKLLAALEDNDDVNAVHANFDIDDEVIERVGA